MKVPSLERILAALVQRSPKHEIQWTQKRWRVHYEQRNLAGFGAVLSGHYDAKEEAVLVAEEWRKLSRADRIPFVENERFPFYAETYDLKHDYYAEVWVHDENPFS